MLDAPKKGPARRVGLKNMDLPSRTNQLRESQRVLATVSPNIENSIAREDKACEDSEKGVTLHTSLQQAQSDARAGVQGFNNSLYLVPLWPLVAPLRSGCSLGNHLVTMSHSGWRCRDQDQDRHSSSCGAIVSAVKSPRSL